MLVSLRDCSRSPGHLSGHLIELRRADPNRSQHLLCRHLESRNHYLSVLKIKRKEGGGESSEGKRKETAKTELGLQSAYELYIKTIRHKENDRGKAWLSRTSSVTLGMSKCVFFFPLS